MGHLISKPKHVTELITICDCDLQSRVCFVKIQNDKLLLCPNYRDCLYTDTLTERERGGVWSGTYLAMSEVRSSYVQSTPHVLRPQRLTHTHTVFPSFASLSNSRDGCYNSTLTQDSQAIIQFSRHTAVLLSQQRSFLSIDDNTRTIDSNKNAEVCLHK